MNSQPSIVELRRPFAVEPRSEAGDMLVDDVTQITQRVPFVEVAPTRLWTAGLVSELADAVDRLAVKLSKLKEAQGADR